MEDVKNFVQAFTQQEAETIYLRRQPDIEQYNTALERMNNYCIESLHNKFGMLPLQKLDDKKYYNQWNKKKYPNPRFLYKISHYKNENYGDVYAVYVSERAPMDNMFGYGDCWFVTKVTDEFKIVKDFAFGNETMSKKKFDISIGIEDISFKALQKPIAIERYLKPEDDEDAMKHYEMDI